MVSSDKLTVYLSSDRPGGPGAGLQIWRAHREKLEAPFGTPKAVLELATSGSERPGWLSLDNCHLYLTSSVLGTNDIYLATRTK